MPAMAYNMVGTPRRKDVCNVGPKTWLVEVPEQLDQSG